MIKYTCPICDYNFHEYPSWPHIPSTPWSDDCVCCDQICCVAHQCNPEDMPVRPHEDDLLIIAEQRAKEKKDRFNKKINEAKERYEELKRLADLTLKIKERFCWTFETIDEFEDIIKSKINGEK